MADFEKLTNKKGFFSWLKCKGGCNKTLKLKTEDKGRKIRAKNTSCFDGLWSCIRCCMRTKNSQQLNFEESEAAQPQKGSSVEFDLELLDLIMQIQNRRMDDQRCRLPLKQSAAVTSTNANKDVDGMQSLTLNDLKPGDTPRSQGLNSLTEKQQSSGDRQITPYVPNFKLLDPKDILLDDLQYVATLGKGGFGHVELMTLKTDQTQSFALKSIGKKHIIDSMKQRYVLSEKDIMMTTNCAFITRMYWAHTDKKYIYMLLEVCLGGDLERLLHQRRYFYDDMARFYIACLVLALQYLHNSGIVHRDLKPANLFLDSKGFLKLGDFGFAWKLSVREMSWANCGTLFYKAPEVFLGQGHNTRADYWSLGVILFELLSGRRPFEGYSCTNVEDNILQGIDWVKFSSKIGRNAKDLIKSLCQQNPYQRLGITRIKQHEWFQNFPWDGLISRSVRPPFVPEVKGPTDIQYFKKHRRRKRKPPDVPSGCDLDF